MHRVRVCPPEAMMQPTSSRRPVLFGEILFDRFADGREILGGAPFNVAWHLRGFGLDPLVISRVGRDARAETALALMREWGMDPGGIQRDPHRPTGLVKAILEEGQPRFVIEADQAYDHIDGEAARGALAGVGAFLLCHGTLALRAAPSLAAMEGVRARAERVLVDVNLRAPWWTPERLHGALRGARWAKLSDEELAVLDARPADAPEDPARLALAAREIAERFRLDALLVTRGAQGSLFADPRGGVHHEPAAPVETLVDTVGAGDAFTAVALVGWLEGWDPPVLLRRAAAFAAEICGQAGATAADPDLYARHRSRWRSNGEGHG